MISFIISSPYFDSGIKSLGSKSIYPIKKNTILEKQYKAISKLCKDIEHEILMVNNIDQCRTTKFLENKKLNIQHVHIDSENTNHGGCLLKGLSLAKYPVVINIENGLVLSYHALEDAIKNNLDCDINIGCIGHKHKQNQDIDIGCVLEHSTQVNNIFFGLENKCIGLSRINSKTKDFMLKNFTFEKDKNKYIFELINQCISGDLVCKKTDLKSKDVHLIFNKKSLKQYIGE
tara:strand:- start:121 stop:816 length:696 start_codon:yes stop_codon:yes gene_type:complete